MGDGWWQASDGKWYPPEQHPDATASGPAAGSETPAEQPQTEPTPAAAGSPPPAAPPTAPPAATAAGGSGGGGKRIIIGVIVVVALAAAGFAALTFLGDDEASASEVTLESIGDAGQNPYTDSLAPAPSASLSDFAENGAPEGAQLADFGTDEGSGYRTADGGVPGVFGGTLDEESCDAGQLAEFLEGEPDKAAAWASVLEIDPADIGDYVDRLTPINLTADTRVLNHGYVDGEPAPRESVLQRGSAVLVDTRGVPRVNCYSGNPLREPEVVGDEDFAGDGWDGFSETEVLVVRQAPSELGEFELLDYETGERFRRPAGAAGDDEEPDDTATQEIGEDREIEPNTLVEDQITEARPEARYTVEIPGGAIITLSVANERESLRALHLAIGIPGEPLDTFRVSPGVEEELTYVLDHDAGGIYEVVITEGPAAFALEVGVEVQDEAGSGGDAGDDVSTALEIGSGDDVVGLLGSGDRTDLYTLELEPGTELQLTTSNERTSERAFLLQLRTEGDGLFSERIAPGEELEFSVLLGPDDDGILDISVEEGPADYAFAIELVPQADGGQDGDAGSELADGRELTDLAEIVGTVGNRDDADVFLFEAPGPALQLTASNAADSDRAYLVRVVAADGSGEASFRVAPGATETEDFEAEPGTQYQLVVSEGPAAYTIGIAPAPVG